MTVAFASPGHADAALRFIAGSSLVMTATRRPVGHDEDMALVDIEIRSRDRARLETLLLGVHAFVLEETSAGAAIA